MLRSARRLKPQLPSSALFAPLSSSAPPSPPPTSTAVAITAANMQVVRLRLEHQGRLNDVHKIAEGRIYIN